MALDQSVHSAIRNYLFDVCPGQAGTTSAGCSGTRSTQLMLAAYKGSGGGSVLLGGDT